MVDSIRLYISAASDLLAERDILNRSITEIPVPLGWKIFLSPIREKQINREALIRTDIHLLILGEDIRAPVGFEWYLSRRAQKTPLTFLKSDILRTPAAQSFHREISPHTNWQDYHSLADLRIKAIQQIGQHILALETYYELNAHEVENLSNFINDIKNMEPDSIESVHPEAGENSVIFSRDRFTPRDGILIEPPPDEDPEDVDNGI